MRPRFQISATGSLIVILIAALGFAAISARGSTPEQDPVSTAEMPTQLSARVAAAGLASGFVTIEPEQSTTIAAIEASPAPRDEPANPGLADRASTRSEIEATPTTPPPTTTTTQAPPPPATTTTTTVPPTTTTTQPPTTTTQPPTTTTQPPDNPPVEGGPRDIEEWRPLVSLYFPEELIDGALSVIRCESLGDPLAYNSSSGASGLFQFIPGTWAWASQDAGFAGASPFDPEANVATAAWLVQASIDQGKDPWIHWSCKP